MPSKTPGFSLAYYEWEIKLLPKAALECEPLKQFAEEAKLKGLIRGTQSWVRFLAGKLKKHEYEAQQKLCPERQLREQVKDLQKQVQELKAELEKLK